MPLDPCFNGLRETGIERGPRGMFSRPSYFGTHLANSHLFVDLAQHRPHHNYEGLQKAVTGEAKMIL